MGPERFREVEAWFDRLVGLPGPELARALDDLGRRDPRVAAEVRSLIDADQQRGGFLAVPALGAVSQLEGLGPGPREDEGELIGRQLGPYRVVQRIASGGMGTVYLAERAAPPPGDFQQQVAIKLIRRGLDSDEVLRRFREERRALAAMNHPGIARLIDGGAAEGGRPFLVMEYVKGIPIDESCRERALPLRQRIELFRRVCDAVQYAHQNLVIHRDLKPQNVLVTGEGLPKLVDFGVARMLGPSADKNLTREVGTRFTPEYASPEQVRGEHVTTASDVYSLGVLLYELLAEAPPYRFRERTAGEFRRIICETEPPPPSTVAAPAAPPPDPSAIPGASPAARPAPRSHPALRGDLDRIILKAMAKDPALRYGSAEGLSADLGRYLEGRPVLARPATPGYLARRFIRRHKAGVAAGALVAASVIAGAAGIAWQARIAARERDDAITARAQAQEITRFIQEILAQADPANRGDQVTVAEALDDAAARARAELAGRPAVLAAILGTIGRTYLRLGLFDRAEPQLVDALALRESAAPPAPPADLVGALVDLATLRYQQRRFPESADLLRRALAAARQRIGERSAEAAEALNSLGAVERNLGQPTQALATLTAALGLRREIHGAESLEAAETLNNLGGVHRDLKNLPAAEQAQREALRIRESLLAHDHPMVAQGYANLAVMIHAQGRLDEAEPLYRASLTRSLARLGPDHPDNAFAMNNLGVLESARGNLPAAEELLREAARVRALAHGAADTRTLTTRMLLARVQDARGQRDAAERTLQDALAQADPGPPGDAARHVLRSTLADLYSAWGMPEKAAEHRPAPPPPNTGPVAPTNAPH